MLSGIPDGYSLGVSEHVLDLSLDSLTGSTSTSFHTGVDYAPLVSQSSRYHWTVNDKEQMERPAEHTIVKGRPSEVAQPIRSTPTDRVLGKRFTPYSRGKRPPGKRRHPPPTKPRPSPRALDVNIPRAGVMPAEGRTESGKISGSWEANNNQSGIVEVSLPPPRRSRWSPSDRGGDQGEAPLQTSWKWDQGSDRQSRRDGYARDRSPPSQDSGKGVYSLSPERRSPPFKARGRPRRFDTEPRVTISEESDRRILCRHSMTPPVRLGHPLAPRQTFSTSAASRALRGRRIGGPDRDDQTHPEDGTGPGRGDRSLSDSQQPEHLLVRPSSPSPSFSPPSLDNGWESRRAPRSPLHDQDYEHPYFKAFFGPPIDLGRDSRRGVRSPSRDTEYRPREDDIISTRVVRAQEPLFLGEDSPDCKEVHCQDLESIRDESRAQREDTSTSSFVGATGGRITTPTTEVNYPKAVHSSIARRDRRKKNKMMEELRRVTHSPPPRQTPAQAGSDDEWEPVPEAKAMGAEDGTERPVMYRRKTINKSFGQATSVIEILDDEEELPKVYTRKTIRNQALISGPNDPRPLGRGNSSPRSSALHEPFSLASFPAGPSPIQRMVSPKTFM